MEKKNLQLMQKAMILFRKPEQHKGYILEEDSSEMTQVFWHTHF